MFNKKNDMLFVSQRELDEESRHLAWTKKQIINKIIANRAIKKYYNVNKKSKS